MSFKLKLRLLIFRDDIAAKELAQEIKNDLSKLAPEARECYENVFSKYIELVTFKHFGFFVLLCFPHIVKIIISMLFSYSLDSVCDERLKQKAAILSVAKTYT